MYVNSDGLGEQTEPLVSNHHKAVIRQNWFDRFGSRSGSIENCSTAAFTIHASDARDAPASLRFTMPLTIDKGLIRHLWAQQTFTTRAKTEQLLRPELEPAGTLTVGDFEKAVDFYPGEQRRLPVCVARSTSFSCCASS